MNRAMVEFLRVAQGKYSLLLLLLAIPLQRLYTQHVPVFQEISTHTYGIKDGLPDLCIQNIMLDSKGRLHLATCGTNYASAALQVYEFDGAQVYPSKFKLEHEPKTILFEKGIAPDLLYGYYSYQTKSGSLRYAVFQYNGISRITQCFRVPEQATVQNVVFAQGNLYACIYDPATGKTEIMGLQDGAFRSLYNCQIETPVQNLILGVTEHDFWLGASAGFIYRIDRKNGALHQYTLPNAQDAQLRLEQICTRPDNAVWIKYGGIYYWDAAKDRFIQNPYLPASWKHSTVIDCLISRFLLNFGEAASLSP